LVTVQSTSVAFLNELWKDFNTLESTLESDAKLLMLISENRTVKVIKKRFIKNNLFGF
jgi:hypothetical protein